MVAPKQGKEEEEEELLNGEVPSAVVFPKEDCAPNEEAPKVELDIGAEALRLVCISIFWLSAGKLVELKAEVNTEEIGLDFGKIEACI